MNSINIPRIMIISMIYKSQSSVNIAFSFLVGLRSSKWPALDSLFSVWGRGGRGDGG